MLRACLIIVALTLITAPAIAEESKADQLRAKLAKLKSAKEAKNNAQAQDKKTEDSIRWTIGTAYNRVDAGPSGNTYDSDTFSYFVSGSKKLGEWRLSATVSKAMTDLDTSRGVETETDNVGVSISARRGLWQGGNFTGSVNYGLIDTDYDLSALTPNAFYGFDAKSRGATVGVSHYKRLFLGLAVIGSANYNYSIYDRDSYSVFGRRVPGEKTSSNSFKTDLMFLFTGLPFIQVQRVDTNIGDDRVFYRVSSGKNFQLSKGRSLNLGVNTTVGRDDYDQWGLSLSYSF